MKPAWDQLMGDFASSKTALVADVDCTTEDGQELCEEHGIQGFPTLKYGHPDDLEDYEGPRDYESLKKFADENLKPMCSVFNLELCDDEKKAVIQQYKDMVADGSLEKTIAEKEAELEKLEQQFETNIESLQATYEKMMEEYEESVQIIKKSGLSMMKSVLAASKSNGGSKEEL